MTTPPPDPTVFMTDHVTVTEFSLLKQDVAGLKVDLHSLTTKIDTFLSTRQTSAWRILGFIAMILVPLAFVVNLYITSAISPWAAIANQAKAASEGNSAEVAELSKDMGTVKSQNADSKRDRDDQRAEQIRLNNEQNQFERNYASDNAERHATEREIETQMDAMAQAINVELAAQGRKNSDFQNALHDLKAVYPAAPNGPYYFPNISNRRPAQYDQ